MRIFQQKENVDELMTELEHQGLSTKSIFRVQICPTDFLVILGRHQLLLGPSQRRTWMGESCPGSTDHRFQGARRSHSPPGVG